MKTYTMLPIPSTTAWERKGFRLNWRLRRFFEGVRNITRWLPILWNDHDWDGVYILNILQKKIEFQRKYLVRNNRHLNIERDNFYMTLTLNLIERIKEGHYETESYDYVEWGEEPFSDPKKTDYPTYLQKYKGALRRLKVKNSDIQQMSEDRQSFYLGMYNQERANGLLFRVLRDEMMHWWD